MKQEPAKPLRQKFGTAAYNIAKELSPIVTSAAGIYWIFESPTSVAASTAFAASLAFQIYSHHGNASKGPSFWEEMDDIAPYL